MKFFKTIGMAISVALAITSLSGCLNDSTANEESGTTGSGNALKVRGVAASKTALNDADVILLLISMDFVMDGI